MRFESSRISFCETLVARRRLLCISNASMCARRVLSIEHSVMCVEKSTVMMRTSNFRFVVSTAELGRRLGSHTSSSAFARFAAESSHTIDTLRNEF